MTSPTSPPTCGHTASASTPAGWTRSPSSGSPGSAPRCSTTSRSNCAARSSPGTPWARSRPPAARPATSTPRWNAAGAHHRRRPPAPRASPATATPSRCWPPTTPTSRSAGCATGPGSRPARCTPRITVDTPLRFELVDMATGASRGGCTYHVSHPGGRAYDSPPVNAVEAESRRGTAVRGPRLHPGAHRRGRPPGEAGAAVHRCRRAWHPRPAPGAYRAAELMGPGPARPGRAISLQES